MRSRLLCLLGLLLATATPPMAQTVTAPVDRTKGIITVAAAPTGACDWPAGQIRQLQGTIRQFYCSSGTVAELPTMSSATYDANADSTVDTSASAAALATGSTIGRLVGDTDQDGTNDFWIGQGGVSQTPPGTVTVTIGPALDLTGDGTAEGRDSDADGTIDTGGAYDFVCPASAALAGTYSLWPCMTAALAAHNGSALAPVVFLLAPATYFIETDSAIVFDGATNVTVRGVARAGTVVLSDDTYAFYVRGAANNVAFENMSVGNNLREATTQTAFAFQAETASGSFPPGASFHLTDITFDGSDNRSSGMAMLFGSDTSPGPTYHLSGIQCNAGHYCVDVKAGADMDADDSLDQYATVVSAGNVYAVEGHDIMPVDVIGGSVHYFSSGDTYVGDCMALGITNYVAPTIDKAYAGSKIVMVSGATFYVGAPADGRRARASCVNYPGGPAAIVLGANNGQTNYSNDFATDVIQITGGSIYVQSEGGLTHSIVRHRGLNSIVRLSGVAFATDTTTGLQRYWESQNGEVLYSGGINLNSDTTDDSADGWTVGTDLQWKAHYGYIGSDKMVLFTPGQSGLNAIVNFDFDGTFGGNSGMSIGQPANALTTNDAVTQSLEFSGGEFRIGSQRGGNGAHCSFDPFDYEMAFSCSSTTDDYFADGQPELGTDAKPFNYVYVGPGSSYSTGNGVWFEGTLADAYEGLLTAANVTAADKAWTLPDATGTLALASGVDSSGVIYWGDGTDAKDTGTEVCAAAGLTCLDVYTVAGDTTGTCATDMGAAGTRFYALCYDMGAPPLILSAALAVAWDYLRRRRTH